ncbi:MAG: hypothetical protein DMG96_30550 [Acidobacteria bacterium]|nr:MAG: hypothetical protein DMG96_30550 [Acidobacteriota bacterium]
MRVTLIVLTVVMALQAAAQNTPASSVFATNTAITEHPQHIFLFASTKKTQPKVLDRKFLVLAGMATAATVLDLATTSHCMATYANCQEGNPLLGSHPSQAKLYGVNFSLLAGELFASAWIRRKTPEGKSWMAPPIVATAVHGLAAALNIRKMHQLAQ